MDKIMYQKYSNDGTAKPSSAANVRQRWLFVRTEHCPGYNSEKYEWTFDGTEKEAREKLNELISRTFSPFITFTFRAA